MRLGIRIGHSSPLHPQTQGEQERFHQTLKLELLHDAHYRTLELCQVGMDHWREKYNQQRSHQALGQKPPLSRCQSSPTAYPGRLLDADCESGERVPKARTKRQMHLECRVVFISEGLTGKRVAIRPSTEDDAIDTIFINKTVRQVDLRQS
jgi:hypothetical protein